MFNPEIARLLKVCIALVLVAIYLSAKFTARKRLELFDVIGTEGIGAYMIDQKIPEIGPPAETGAEDA